MHDSHAAVLKIFFFGQLIFLNLWQNTYNIKFTTLTIFNSVVQLC